ncbi:MAG: metalloregulator ArsR/SmtB family transcription factor [Clostridia bacterium]|nr:metalloregulator ArsR/SmtB family transcription factor [Clostridia bacterium]
MAEIRLPHSSDPHSHVQLERVPETDDFQVIANTFKQLCDTSRIRIFWLLCHYEECVLNISALVDMSSPAVSHHLRQLKASGLIVSRREGKEVYYKAADTEEVDLLHHMIEKLVEVSCPSKSE